jgi:hypothetical protein
MPGGNSKWYEMLESEQPRTVATRNVPVKRSLPEGSTPATMTASTQKKRRRNTRSHVPDNVIDFVDMTPNHVSQNDNSGLFELEIEDAAPNQLMQPQAEPFLTSADIKPSPRATEIANESYWESPEAHALFCEIKKGVGVGDESDLMPPRHCVEERIERLKQPSAGVHGWKLVVDDFDTNELCSASDVFNIQMKSKYMSLSLRFALEEMNAWKWRDCCNEEVKQLNRLEGHQYITSGKTIMNWHHSFRNHHESFRNPRFDSHGKVKLPPLLERNPEFKMSFVRYAMANLNDLSAELLLAYLHDMALPALLEEFREELDFPEYTMFQLLQEHRLTKLSVPTIYLWMRLLGFKYETRQKSYYVDGHKNLIQRHTERSL